MALAEASTGWISSPITNRKSSSRPLSSGSAMARVRRLPASLSGMITCLRHMAEGTNEASEASTLNSAGDTSSTNSSFLRMSWMAFSLTQPFSKMSLTSGSLRVCCSLNSSCTCMDDSRSFLCKMMAIWLRLVTLSLAKVSRSLALDSFSFLSWLFF